MPKQSDRSSGPEHLPKWEEISRAVVLQSHPPEDLPSEKDLQMREALDKTPQTGLAGCGCLGSIVFTSGLITLCLSILMLLGGEAGSFARQLVEGNIFEGPGLSTSEVWSTLIAPSLVLIALGAPFVVLSIRNWHKARKELI